MADVFPAATRSRIMSRIRSKGNRSTERRLIQIFREQGITGWRRGVKLIGRPDFVFHRQRVVIFVDGCFWHGCPQCRNTPVTNAAYWENKNTRNRKRDRLVTRVLAKSGWRVIRIWEHRLREARPLTTSWVEACRPVPIGRRRPENKSALSGSFALYKTARGQRLAKRYELARRNA
jgi:DNA mismatch endonuclease (patch repair protein)